MSRLPDGYRIRAERPESVARLAEVEAAAAAMFDEADLPAELRDEGMPLAVLARAAREGRLWTAETSDGTAVGFALATSVDDEAHLRQIDVHPDHGRRGLGRALVARVVDWARDQGLDAVTLTTFRHVAWNAPFYARLGFEELTAASAGPQLRALLDEEARDGLDPAKRVAMRLRLGAASASVRP
jgi:GNAT superfamily N-acetyltransferase